MKFQSSIKKVIKKVKKRLYIFHPKSLIFDFYYKRKPDFPLIVTIKDGIKARIWSGDTIGKGLYVSGSFEEEETSFISKILREGMIFFDIGANMGYYSLLGAELVGPSGEVHCFEPSPRMFEELTFNVNINGFENIRISNIALAEKCGVAHLSKYERGKEVYGSLSNFAHPGASIIGYDEVNVETLNRYITANSVERIDLIKMDTEGAELLILKGATKLLARDDAPIIMFEMSENLAQCFNYSCKDVLDFLKLYNFMVYIISHGNYVAAKKTHSSYDKIVSLGLSIPDGL